MPRVVIAAGGTAGHVVPALAVADALRAEGAEVSLPRRRATAPRPSWSRPRATRSTSSTSAGSTAATRCSAAGALGLAAAAVPAARRVLRERGADAVLGGGGYVAAPGGPRGALGCGLPLVLTEADRHLGLDQPAARPPRAPRLPRVPDRRPRGRALPGHRPAGAGRGRRAPTAPPRAAVRDRGRRALPARLRRQPGRAVDQPRGARGVRRAGGRPSATSTSSTSAARRDYAEARGRLEAAGRAERYTLLEYEPGLADALAASDLVLARAGGSIFEIAAAGRPAILVPYPHASGDHQHANAEWMAEAGAAVVIEDAELDPRAARARLAATLLGDPDAARTRWPPPRRRSPAPTPPSGSRTRSLPRSANLPDVTAGD